MTDILNAFGTATSPSTTGGKVRPSVTKSRCWNQTLYRQLGPKAYANSLVGRYETVSGPYASVDVFPRLTLM